MVKRLDNQPRMEDVFSTNSRNDNEGKNKELNNFSQSYQNLTLYTLTKIINLFKNTNIKDWIVD